ncbi:MAG TPA: hypothetical protein VFQ45_09775 [Longimicrobium sp.]|nr:hypothetical protein [Longimicrobium sp.]
MLLLLGGCADSPTGVEADGGGPAYENLQGCVTGGICLLDPLTGGGTGECDPWTDLTWCETDEGSCLTAQPISPEDATLATCSTGGGPGGTPYDPTNPDDPYGIGQYPPVDEPECNPLKDPNCNQPLTAADSATIRKAIERHKRPASEFTSDANAQQCEALLETFNQLWADGKVFRGGYDTPEGDAETGVHYGLYDRDSKTMHFEPSTLDAANRGDATAIRNVFNTALHEAAHALEFDHTPPIMMGSYDLYAEYPFNLLSPGSNSCITNW